MGNNSSLTLGSLFDGSGGFPLGGLLSGIRPIWSSEIEPFPIRVTTKRLPQVKHYGDISKINGGELEPVDIITFGSPCQDMSIAGKRDGLGGSKSRLFYEAIRIIKEMRNKTDGQKPRFIVWENVPGAFSSNKGEDFRVVLEAICKIKDCSVSVPKPSKWKPAGKILGDGYSLAWRQFDAQFWGVPQRRKRIYLVADFRDWCAGKILFESESVSGYSKKSIPSWQSATATTGESLTNASISLMFENHSQDARYKGPLSVSQTVLSTYGMGGNNQPFIVENVKNFDVRLTSEGTKNARHNVYETDTARTIDTGGNSPDANQGGIAVVAYGISSAESNAMKSANPNSGCYLVKTARTIDGNGSNPACHQGGIAVIEGNGSRQSHKGDGYKETDIMYTLNATEQHGVAYGIGRPAMSQGYNAQYSFQIEEEVEPTIVAAGASGVAHPVYSSSKASFFTAVEEGLAGTLVATDYKDPPIVNEPKYIVRRLTPTECARLQGFPDWWCSNLETENPTEEDVIYWRGIFETHAEAMGKIIKLKSDKQIRRWLQNPHSDSAEYKMWGNGVALPNVVFVLTGIVYYAQTCAD
jgi:DNA (cytosine-5)-methyltransferase 1